MEMEHLWKTNTAWLLHVYDIYMIVCIYNTCVYSALAKGNRLNTPHLNSAKNDMPSLENWDGGRRSFTHTSI